MLGILDERSKSTTRIYFTFPKNFEKIELAIKSIEGSYDKLLEAEKNIKIIKNLENEIIILKKEKVASLELIDQALQEIKLLKFF